MSTGGRQKHWRKTGKGIKRKRAVSIELTLCGDTWYAPTAPMCLSLHVGVCACAVRACAVHACMRVIHNDMNIQYCMSELAQQRRLRLHLRLQAPAEYSDCLCARVILFDICPHVYQ